jgi:hypothetical protein
VAILDDKSDLYEDYFETTILGPSISSVVL